MEKTLLPLEARTNIVKGQATDMLVHLASVNGLTNRQLINVLFEVIESIKTDE